jgi:hypothetical protein
VAGEEVTEAATLEPTEAATLGPTEAATLGPTEVEGNQAASSHNRGMTVKFTIKALTRTQPTANTISLTRSSTRRSFNK